MCADHGPELPRLADLPWGRRVLVAPILAYKRWISPLLPPACRFEPSCSVYAMRAIELWGVRGVGMAAMRLLRCQPFSAGGWDPVPLPPSTPGSPG